jgi:hypothetical protein
MRSAERKNLGCLATFLYRPHEFQQVAVDLIHEFIHMRYTQVHQLAAILLRRWQAEEIAKTPFPCVSRISIKHRVPNKLGE